MAAGRSAVPAAEAKAVSAITRTTGPSNANHRGEDEHLQHAKHVADEQYGAAVVAVGDGATHRAEQRRTGAAGQMVADTDPRRPSPSRL